MNSSPSRMDSSPSNQLHRESRRHQPSTPRARNRNSPANRRSPVFWETLDSPSRQLIEEFGRVLIHSDRCFKARLDKDNAEQEKRHTEALEAAAKKHADVLKGAEIARDALRLQLEWADAERKRREEEEIERLRSEKAAWDALQQKIKQDREAAIEKERLERESTEQAHQARLKADKEHALKLAAAQKVQEHRAQLQQQQDQLAKAEADSRKQQQAQVPATNPTALVAPSSSATSVLPATTAPPEVEAEHAAYLALHKKLKDMRRYMTAQYKEAIRTKNERGTAVPAIAEMSDMRRELTKYFGQLTSDKKKNVLVRTHIRDVLGKAWNNKSITMDAREFIINPSSPITDSPDVQVSGTFIFLLNILVKQGVKIMPTSASMTAYNAVDPIGVIIAYCLSLSTFHVQGNSFVDILLAKYHFSCPPLFGIWGSEKTDQGRARLGWSREGGKWVSPTHHFEKLNGLACGWAALTLRDFSKSREKNPLPAWRYWRSIAFILNVPPAQITQSQGVILKGLIEHYAQHFCKSFQQSALNALRMAIIQRPREAAAAGNTALEGVVVLKDTLVKDFAIHL